MFVKGLTVAHTALKLAWLAGTIGMLAVIIVPGLLPALGRQVYVVEGGSMEPAIPLGSVIIVHAVDPTQVTIGQVVTFRLQHGTIVTHRVTAISEDGSLAFQTKGDASLAADPVPVPASALVGGVEFALPGVGFLIHMLGSAPGTLLAVAILGALLIVAWSTEQLLVAMRPSSPPRTAGPVGTLT